MKSIKRIISVFLTAVILICSTPLALIQFSAIGETFEENGFRYIVENGCATIKKYSEYCTTLNIPSTLGGYNVAKIDDEAFNANDMPNLTSVSMPDTITILGANVFFNFKNLETVTVPANLKEIGPSAFRNCIKLDASALVSSTKLETIGDSAFGGCYCSEFTTVNFPESLTYLGSYSFANCKSIKTVNIGKNLEALGIQCFNGCSSLTTVTFADSSKLNTVGSYAFSGCTALSTIKLPAGTKQIDDCAFISCTSLNTFEIPETVETLGLNIFNSSNISSLVFGGTSDEWEDVENSNNYSNIPLTCKYKVSFIVNGDEYAHDYFINGEAVDLNKFKPVVKHYDFTGWAEDEGKEALKSLTMPRKNIVLYAVLSPTVYYVKFRNANGTSLGIPDYAYTYETRNQFTLPDLPQTEGYKGKWNPYEFPLPAGGITITASYEVEQYILTFFNEDDVISSETVNFGSPVEAPEMEKIPGKVFEWDTEVPQTMPAKDLNIKGKYADEKYDARVHNENGDVIAVIQYIYGQKSVKLPDVPGKTGYEGKWNSYSLPIGGTDIYPTYTLKSYKLTFVIDGISSSSNVEYGSVVTVPQIEEKECTEFHWQQQIPATMPASDVTITGNHISTCTLSINNYPNNGKTNINYGESLILSVTCPQKPTGAEIQWSTTNGRTGKGTSFNTGTLTDSGVTVTVKLVKDGNTIKDANGNDLVCTQEVGVNGGIIRIILSFILNLFRQDRNVIQ